MKCRFCGSEQVAQVVKSGGEWVPWCVECWDAATQKMVNRQRNIRDCNRVVAVELKGVAGKCTEEQLEWLYAFDEAGAETHIWNPSDWHSGAILKTLKGDGAPASIEAPQ